MAYSTKGLKRKANTFQSSWRDPRDNGKIKTAQWTTSDIQLAAEWKAKLDIIRNNRDLWDNPPQDTPAPVLKAWQQGKYTAEISGIKIPTDIEPSIHTQVAFLDKDGNEVVADTIEEAYYKADQEVEQEILDHTDDEKKRLLIEQFKKLNDDLQHTRRRYEESQVEIAALKKEIGQMRVDLSQYRKTVVTANDKPYDDVVKEHLLFFQRAGGARGRPGSKNFLAVKRAYLKKWGEILSVKTLSDIKSADVEAFLMLKRENGSSKNTVAMYFKVLNALINWAAEREYVSGNTIRRLAKIARSDDNPERVRPISDDEISKLISSVPPERALWYKTAIGTGFRLNELRSLTVASLKRSPNKLFLPAEYTKNRKDALQTINPSLYVELYKCARKKTDDAPLLGIPLSDIREHSDQNIFRPAKQLQIDIKNAKINTKDIGWKSFRRRYIDRLLEKNCDLKTLMTLARHSTAQLSLEVYASADDERLAKAVDWKD